MSNILFIGLPYHGYINALTDEMKAQGHTVTFYPVELRRTRDKILHTLSHLAYRMMLDKFHRRLIRSERESKFDYIIFLQVHTFSMINFIRLKESHPESKYILYTWDARSRKIDYVPYIPFFDKACTFDPADAKTYCMDYLPLFCMRDFQNPPLVKPDIDVYMVGNLVNPERYKAVLAFEKYCLTHQISFRKYLKCTPVVLLQLLINGIIPRGLKLRSLSRSEFMNLFQRSACTFDFSNHKQSGYTMRLVENMCSGKKIITNNKRILREPFYSPDRFFVFDGFYFKGVGTFIQQPIEEETIRLDDFYIQSFVKNLLTV